MSETKLLDLTNDVAFQALFGEVGNERITKKQEISCLILIYIVK